jgi:hypothetical protein
MAGALGIEQALEDGDRMGRGHADGLVENHPAMDIAAITLLLAALALLFASLLLARIVMPHAGCGKIIFGRRVRIGGLRREHAVWSGHIHQSWSESVLRSF